MRLIRLLETSHHLDDVVSGWRFFPCCGNGSGIWNKMGVLPVRFRFIAQPVPVRCTIEWTTDPRDARLYFCEHDCDEVRWEREDCGDCIDDILTLVDDPQALWDKFGNPKVYFDQPLNESASDFVWADIEEQEIMDGAWAIAQESPINVLSDMDLIGAVIRNTPHRDPGSEDVVGAWFGGCRDGGSIFSFDLVVDPAYQGKGIGRMLFDNAMGEASDSGCAMVSLIVHHPSVAHMAQKAGFLNVGGVLWEKEL